MSGPERLHARKACANALLHCACTCARARTQSRGRDVWIESLLVGERENGRAGRGSFCMMRIPRCDVLDDAQAQVSSLAYPSALHSSVSSMF